MPAKDPFEAEQRQYIRLDSVFPVQFQLIGPDGKTPLSGWLQGFTNNISKGGLCLEVNNLSPESARLIKSRQVKLSLAIDIPLGGEPISALAKIAWVKEITAQPDKYLIGLNYEDMPALGNKRIIRYARAKKLFFPVVLIIIILLGLGFAVDSWLNVKLIKGNKALVEQLINVVQESSVAKEKIKQISAERQGLQAKAQALEERIKRAEAERTTLQEKVREQEQEQAELKEKAKLAEEARLEGEKTSRELGEFNALIEKLTQEKDSLQKQLIALQRRESAVSEEASRLDKKKVVLEKANLDKMYQWLKVHQNPRTGLVVSFEGDSDIANWGFTYDQSLVVLAHSAFSDFERAKKILDFFDKRAKRAEGIFVNAYYVSDGSPAEYVVHSGPNIWLGIAALQYSKKSQDYTYLKLAGDIAQGIISLQKQDKEGGLRGGPNAAWYSTEHNLDAYAFFNMFYEINAKPLYLECRDKALNWLMKHAYDQTEVPVKRGKGDSAIATDTYAYSILALGPEKLTELGMDPERIVDFAEQQCAVEVFYARPEGQIIKIKGFDFAPQRHLARGGVVSSEWTAQMILAFKIMADYYDKKNMAAKAGAYLKKADEYLAELVNNMVISSPSPSGQGQSCLPYATQDFVDTGHGWMTPKGKSTGSLAGTAYTLLAHYNYNPLALKE